MRYEGSAPRRLPFWLAGLIFLASFVGMQVIGVIGGFVLAFLVAAFPHMESFLMNDVFTAVNAAASLLSFGLPMVLLVRHMPELAPSLRMRRFSMTHLLLGVVALVCLLLSGSVAGYWWQRLIEALEVPVLENIGFPPTDTFARLISMTLLVCVVPGFTEEFLLRGVLLSGSGKHRAFTAFVLNWLVFVLFHADIQSFGYHMATGFFFVAAAMLSGSVWLSVILHILHNFIITFVEYLLMAEIVTSGTTYTVLTEFYTGAYTSVWIPVVALAVLCLCLLGMFQTRVKTPKYQPILPENHVGWLPVAASFLLFAFLYATNIWSAMALA